ncbi:MAG: hypothetical protein AB7H43_14775 [Acidimicrobiia bacterium]
MSASLLAASAGGPFDGPRIVVLVVAGALVAGLVTRAFAGVLALPVLERVNHRGRPVATASGICLVAAVLAVAAVDSLVGATTAAAAVTLGAVCAFALLGLVDDLLGDAGDRGLAGHVGAALRGRLTTGFVKLAGGAAAAVVLAGALGSPSVARQVGDGALVALAANLANLLDRAPGRVLKVGLLASIPLLAGGGPPALALAPVAGAALGLLPGDLRERFMVGDTGANALGAALGVAVVTSASPTGRTVVAAVLLALTLVSEVVSFSKVIDAVAPLRFLDRLGRVRDSAP